MTILKYHSESHCSSWWYHRGPADQTVPAGRYFCEKTSPSATTTRELEKSILENAGYEVLVFHATGTAKLRSALNRINEWEVISKAAHDSAMKKIDKHPGRTLLNKIEEIIAKEIKVV